MPDTQLPAVARGGRDFEPGRPQPVGHINPNVVDPLAAQGVGVSSVTATAGVFTEGTPVDPSYRVAPPDTTGDLGPNHYVQWVNLRYAIYNVARTNGTINGFSLVNGFPKNGNAVWQGFGGACETYNDGDPIVQYDQLADRWILTQFAVSRSPYMQCVAVSTSGDPTGTYNRTPTATAPTSTTTRRWACGRTGITSRTTSSSAVGPSAAARCARSSATRCSRAPRRARSARRRAPATAACCPRISRARHCLPRARRTTCSAYSTSACSSGSSPSTGRPAPAR